MLYPLEQSVIRAGIQCQVSGVVGQVWTTEGPSAVLVGQSSPSVPTHFTTTSSQSHKGREQNE